MPIQTTYAETLTAGKVGALVNMEHSDIISRTVEDAAGIGFGLPVAQGANDRGCTALGALTLAGTAQADAGNTGNGVLTMASPSVGAGVKEGVYRLVAIEPASDAGQFSIEDPDGVQIGVATVAVAYDGVIKFTIADGGTDFVAGDAFSITVAASDGDTKPIGITVRDRSVRPATPDLFAQYESARILRKGVIWVTAAGTVAAGDPVYVTPAGAFTNADGDGYRKLIGARWENSRTGAGIAQLRINLVDVD